jgi:hypothetical protein
VLAIAKRAPEDLGEEGADRLARRQFLVAPDALGNAPVDVVVERLLVERAFVPKGVVEAGAGDPGLPDQVATSTASSSNSRGLAIRDRPRRANTPASCNICCQAAL